MNNQSTPCPGPLHLEEFFRNGLAEDRHAEVAAHLESCGRCKSRLGEIADDERIVGLLRSAQDDVPLNLREKLATSIAMSSQPARGEPPSQAYIKPAYTYIKEATSPETVARDARSRAKYARAVQAVFFLFAFLSFLPLISVVYIGANSSLPWRNSFGLYIIVGFYPIAFAALGFLARRKPLAAAGAGLALYAVSLLFSVLGSPDVRWGLELVKLGALLYAFRSGWLYEFKPLDTGG